MFRSILSPLMLVGLAAVAVPVSAQQVLLHGYGEWSAGATNTTNDYLSGSQVIDFQSMTFGLAGLARPADRLRVGFLVEWHQGSFGSSFELEAGFGEWTVSDALRFRAGKSRLPFGLYAETLEVGTLRPFFSLPQGFYGPAGIVSDGYDGAGIGGGRYAGNWGINYDVYVGSMRFEDAGSNLRRYLFERTQDRAATAAARSGEVHVRGDLPRVNPITELAGARVLIDFPFPGLTIGGSVFTGMNRDELVRNTVFAPSLSYVAGPFHLRSEYVHREVSSAADFDANAWYVEGAVRVLRPLQLAARYERLQATEPQGSSLAEAPDLSDVPDLLQHRELALGANFWLNQGFVIKASLHLTEGNFFAGPPGADLVNYVDAGILDSRTRLGMLGVQFSF